MLREQLENKIAKYKGSNTYLNQLQIDMKNGEVLNDLKLSLARRILDNKVKTKKKEQKSEARKIKRNIETDDFKLKRFKVSDQEFLNVSDEIVLYDYQKDGVKWLLDAEKGRFLLDEQGTGKTLQTIYACEIGKFKKVIVVCPNYLKYNWKHEISKVCSSVQIVKSEANLRNNYKYNIINYDSIHKYASYISTMDNVDCVICDESH